MKQEAIKQLLERYWQCETSIEEEQWLKDFFSSESVPDALKKYQTLFVWKSGQQAIHAAPTLRFPVRKRPLIQSFYPALKIAASVLIVLTFGLSVYTHYRQEKFIEQMFSEAASDALDAKRDSIDVMAKASLQKLPENDSLLLMNAQPLPTEILKE
ncbi:MAG: hypothetical protein LBB85_05585 [Dysgonamonadaceae bacterium]|jgi:hypothetical protein|nr:hypothetical protein [Dysgonamonadaceae bacterium]